MAHWRKSDWRFVQSIWCIAVVLLIAACQRKVFLSKHNWVGSDSTIVLRSPSHDSISIQYIGCAGFFVSQDTNTLLFDPYFTYHALTTLRLTTENNVSGDLRRDIDRIFTRAIGINHDVSGTIDALLVDHAHVDHFGDVPYLYKSGHLHKNTKVLGSATTGHYLRGHGIDARIAEAVEDSARLVRWIPINSTLRVLPIISEHAPHIVVKGREYNFASGRFERRDRTRPIGPCYGTGQTLAYLVDFLDSSGNVRFRLYHCSAASSAPNGHIPDSVKRRHRVDVAILCAASFNQVDDYPENLIANLKPRYIIFSHWEDFLLSSLSGIKAKPQANFLYDFKRLFSRTERLVDSLRVKSGDTIEYIVPNVDTKMMFRY